MDAWNMCTSTSITTLLTAGLIRHALGRIPFVDTSTCVSIDLRDMGQSIRGNQPAEFRPLACALIQLTGAVGLCPPFLYLCYYSGTTFRRISAPRRSSPSCPNPEEPKVLPIYSWGSPDSWTMKSQSWATFTSRGLALPWIRMLPSSM